MSDADALLAAIRANPRDNLPRLVFADWLQDHGFAAYAEFVRLSCRLAVETLPPAERKAIRAERFARFEEMRAAIRQDEFREVPFHVNHFDRGIGPDAIRVNAEVFVRTAANWWPILTPQTLKLLDPDRGPQIFAVPELRRINHLILESWGQDVEFGGSERWVNRAMSATLLADIVGSPFLESVSVLGIDAIAYSPEELERFARSPLVARLAALRIVVRISPTEHSIIESDASDTPGACRAAIEEFLARAGPGGT